MRILRHVGRLALMLTVLTSVSATDYIEPKVDKFSISREKISISAAERDGLADKLAEYLNLQPANQQLRMAPKLIALGKFLSPTNKAVVILNGKLKRGHCPREYKGIGKNALATLLTESAKKLIASKKGDDLALAAYVLDVALLISPDHEDANFIAESNGMNGKAKWTAILATPNVTSTQPVVQAPQEPAKNRLTPPPRGKRVEVKRGPVHPFYKEYCKRYEKHQANIKGLFVIFTDDGMQGMAMDIIASVHNHADSRRFSSGFAPGRVIGDEMKKAHVEAHRVCTGRYPYWPGGTRVSFSFRDKYSPKDGGSAGTAFTLLMLSLLDGIPLNPEYAVTGDISVDWKVLPVGGVPAKIMGARDANLKGVVIPKENERAVYDLILLKSIKEMYRIHVFSVESLEQAVETVRVDQTEKRKAALELFAKIQERLKKKGVHGINKKVYKALKKVHEDIPESLSCRVLMEAYKNKLLHRQMSLATAVTELMRCNQAVLPLFYEFKPKPGYRAPTTAERLERVTKQDIQDSRDRMRKLAPKLPKDVRQLHKLFADLQRSVETFTKVKRAGKGSSRYSDLVGRELPNRVKVINEELDRLSKDDKFVKRLSKGS